MAWNLVRQLFGAKGSKGEAKNRLQVVLVYDRLGLSGEQMEALRKDIIETISRQISIDPDGVKIDFLHEQSPAQVRIDAPVRRRAGAEASKQQPSAG
jgi:cell division topological specificity factor